jgi:hypothetical protein
MMQMLAAAYAEGETPWGPEREIVTRETAADAVVDVFATLHAFLDGEEVPPERLLATFTALMVVREYIVPLPSPEGDEELLQSDLHGYQHDLRNARDDFDLP